MKHIYLDQNKWVDFARARIGHQEGEVFKAAYASALEAADDGRAAFPLSAAHYYETHKQGSSRKREELADTMLLLSRLTAIAPPHVIVPWEIETALITVFDLAAPLPPAVLTFGQGVNHAFAAELATYEAPTEWEGQPLTLEQRAVATAMGLAMTERLMLSNSVGPDELRSRVALHGGLTGGRFVTGQEQVRDQLANLGRHRLGDVMTSTAFVDIIEPMIAACHRLELNPEDVYGAGRDTLEALLHAMPSRWVERELRRARQSNPQQPWASNDLNDITALSITIPYCDVIVTERQWAAVINTRKINRRFNTTVLRDVRDLVYDA